MYAEFNDDGIIVVNSSLRESLLSAKRKQFNKKAYHDEKEHKFVVYDLSYVACLIFGYVSLFGIIEEENVCSVLLQISQVQHNEVPFEITRPSITENKLAKDILEKIPQVLTKLNLFIESQNKGNHYYHINYETLHMKNKSFKMEDSYLIPKEKMKKSNKNAVIKIRNDLLKEGYKIW